MEQNDRTSRVVYPPLDWVKEEPWAFVFLALAAGLATGILLKFKTLRKGLKVYAKLKA